MKIICISDTHGRYQPELPDGDIIIHAGDHSMGGTQEEVTGSLDWLAEVRPRYKEVILIAGNHDFFAEKFPGAMAYLAEERGLIYLQDSGVEIDGVSFWGSPMTPEFCGWAFMADRGGEIRLYWNQIPNDTDVLITHGPPRGILDHCYGGHVGCADLKRKVMLVEPTLHVFGHIHEGRGEMTLPDLPTHFVNASMLDAQYTPAGREAMTFELET